MSPCLGLMIIVLACQSPIKYPPGGYDFPVNISAKDTNFYYYPIKNKMTRRDSFRRGWDSAYFNAFNEPNLSLRPMSVPYFRFTYSGTLGRLPTIIILTPGEIVVKRGHLSDEFANLPDTNVLTPLERIHLRLLDRNYPIDEKGRHSDFMQNYLDSMGRLYPRLYDPTYYAGLEGRAYAHSAPIYTFSARHIKISYAVFDSLVRSINAAGYWQLPYEIECKDPPIDGPEFSLEANTHGKYNYVSACCFIETFPRPYYQACQDLVRYGGLNQEIHLAPGLLPLNKDSVRHIIVQDILLQEVKEPQKGKRKKK